MDGKINLFQAFARKMDWLGQRQAVLSQNIANADTPDFKPQDMKAGAFARLLARRVDPVTPAVTHTSHISPAAQGDPGFRSGDKGTRYETAPSGNAVVLEEQLIKVGQTQMDHQLMNNLYRKHVQMIRAALGRS